MRWAELKAVMLRLFFWRVLLVGVLAVSARANWSDPQAGRSPLLHFGPRDFGTNDFNWAVVEDKRGHIYVGNTQVLEYDGRTWRTHPIKDGYTVRGLALDDQQRLWVGAFDELGFFTLEADGERRYTSLRHKVPANLEVGEIWNVHCIGTRTLFVTANQVLTWDGETFTARTLPTPGRLFSFKVGAHVWISQPGTALFQTDGKQWTSLDLGGREKDSIGWATEIGPRDWLVGSVEGLFRLAENRVTPLDTAATAVLRRSMSVKAVRLADGTTCVATIFGGLLFLDPVGTPLRVLDRRNGLPSQSITDIALQPDGTLWVTSTHGVFRLATDRSATVFDESLGFNGGIGRFVGQFKADEVFIAAEECVLRHEPASSWQDLGRFSRIEWLNRLFWTGVRRDQGHYLLGGSRTLREVSRFGVRELRTSAFDMFQLVTPPPPHDSLYASEGNRIVELAGGEKEYSSTRVLFELQEPASGLSMDADGMLWIGTARQGLVGLKHPWEATPVRRDLRLGLELPTDFTRPDFFRVAGQTFAYNAKRIVRIQAEGGRPVPILPEPTWVHIEPEGEQSVWGLARWNEQEVQLVQLTRTPTGFHLDAYPARLLRPVGQPVQVLRDPQSPVLWVSGSDGILRLDTKNLRPEPAASAPLLHRAEWVHGGARHRLLLAGPLHLTYQSNASLVLDFRDPRATIEEESPLEYRFGEGEWVRFQGAQTFAGLREGHHTLSVRVPSGATPAGPATSLSVHISPPWQRSLWAYGAYVLLGVALFVGAVTWRLRRIRILNTELQNLVDRRTEELTRATATKGAFLATMGHEILNPLNGVVGLVESLRASRLDARQGKIVSQLANCAHQLTSVVEDVLEYSRLEAGKITLRLRPFALREPVEAALDIFRAVQHPGAGPLRLQAAEGLLDQIRVGAPDRVRHILVNYLSNALKFGAGSPVTLAVRIEALDTVVFSVRDEGPGIPSSEQGFLFHRYHRASLARKNDIPGTGLGLAACKAYAEAMGGEVGVESSPGHGSTFFLRVPLRHATEADHIATVVTTDVLVGKRVLVLDDHEFNRTVLCDTLSRLGAHPFAAADIAEARSLFVTHPPDLALVDFDLGGDSGTDFAAWVRGQAPTGRDVPIIATTAFEVAEVRARCLAAGMDGFLSKPITAWKLCEAAAVIERTRGGSSLTTGQSLLEPPPAAHAMIDLLAEGDPIRHRDLLIRTRTECRREVSFLLRATRRKDWEAVVKGTHRLISVTVLLDQPDLTKVVQELHRAAKAGSETEAVHHTQALRRALSSHRRTWRAT